ncbi:hypothetical protein [Flavihumibacter petaseus]|uniref:Methyltransferase n=1 Tax=Flavihumibacter petaseus NBRC 106054 TaxID=1220578 RepID=A0A0E9N689_9BACT|nr:hypothetical protein [Flavihumibacter petaseus]GAO45226.1 hypothetical protein FPE01S_04_04700 [Flavihumibacter petaseus NBRC 106054]
MFAGIKHKVRRHLGIRDLEKKLDKLSLVSGKIDEIYWAQVFNNTISGSSWLTKQAFSPGRWAAGYPFLYILYRILNETKPQSILEFGLGETTKLTYQYLCNVQTQQQKKLLVIEQDENWLRFFEQNFPGVSKNVLLREIGKGQVKGAEVFQYKDLLEGIGNQQFNLVLVDGPWGSPQYSRYQIVSLVENDKIAADFIIVIDDVNREGESMTLQEVKLALQKKNIPFEEGVYQGVKDTAILVSPQYKFLTSL